MLRKLSSGQGRPSKKHIFGHVTSLRLVKMSSQHIQKYFPGLLHTPAKYEKNLPYGCEAIVKRKCGSGGVDSPMHKQASLVGCLIRCFTFLPPASPESFVEHLDVKASVYKQGTNMVTRCSKMCCTC